MAPPGSSLVMLRWAPCACCSEADGTRFAQRASPLPWALTSVCKVGFCYSVCSLISALLQFGIPELC